MDEATKILAAIEAGESQAAERLLPLVYDELRHLAAARLAGEAPGQTLQATALVHEAWLKIAGEDRRQWQGRTHFFAVAAQLMRRIMVDHARQRQALKRGGGALKVTLDEAAHAVEERAVELLALDEALEKLAALDKRKADVVEMRYFGGLTMEEIADVLKVHVNTVTREWSAARAWLFATLSGEEMDAI